MVSAEGFARDWHRVCALRPRLRAHARIHRHIYRDTIWYVLQDRQTGRHIRVSPAANLLLCLMDGLRTTEELWHAACARLQEGKPTRGDVLRLLVQLSQGDLLQAGLPDMAELGRRAERDRRSRLLGWVRNPLALRLPLMDPDRLLTRAVPVLRAVPFRLVAIAWCLLVLLAAVLAVGHWPELSANVSDRVLSARNVLMLALLYPASKVLHELGHACAIKLGGGEVHEVGIMLLILVPVPYVEGSAANAFPDPRRRMAVAAAGVLVELAIAALALIAWVAIEPGLLRAAMFNLALLCSASTLLFNANPLLRFDGYYVLCDLLQIPNLDARSKQYLLYLVQRRVLGADQVQSPVQAPGEAKWFALYGTVSFLYRLGIMAGIVLVVAAKFFLVGTLLALFGIVQMFVLPLWRAGRYVLVGHQLASIRLRAIGITLGTVAMALLLVFVLPLPYGSVAAGVVWVPEEAMVRAGADGFVERLLTPPGSVVEAGALLVQLDDPAAMAQLEVYRADVRVAEGRFLETNLIDRVQGRIAAEALHRARAHLERGQQRTQGLRLAAARPGRFVVPDAATLPGRFIHKGDVIGYVIGSGDREVHVVVQQAELDLVRQRMRSVSVRSAADGEVTPATVLRQTPGALDRAPVPGLSAAGGGPIVADPGSRGGERPLEQFYEFALRPEAGFDERIGGHAYARFDLGLQPVGWRLLRSARQMTLRFIDG